ncbi:Trihydrophobin [Fusarium oxysporum f. sp. albedinis]|nr:Trihydrophobin [Fusarium oxysporum f. sp. albedinis]
MTCLPRQAVIKAHANYMSIAFLSEKAKHWQSFIVTSMSSHIVPVQFVQEVENLFASLWRIARGTLCLFPYYVSSKVR